ncbi:MAG: signal recognition particle-docking protein FtsY [Eggerthellaceae bacterium]|nr:signal recognition particle-docking protein FtsY [Eggerthellaceae bacterium]MBR2680626.1 signal recognition particle-docking protein FtsY [Exiguobacterium sp.]
MGLFSRFTEGLTKSRESFREDINLLLNRGPKVDEEFWEGLEETLILSDMGGYSAVSIVDKLRNESVRKGYRDAYDVLDALNETIANEFVEGGDEILGSDAIVLFVGVNGSGKTTTCGKIAKQAKDAGRTVILGSGDTFRAAAIEQLEVWAKRADVEIVSRERGSDPASVCYETIERGEQIGADLVLIDTAGRLHTSSDLMRELEKVVSVVRKRANLPVKLVLVIDATTGQNGLQQAREFNSALDLDGVIITKLDGTAKGGIAVAVAHYLNLPIVKLGVGEGLEDLKDFDAHEYAAGLVGDFGRE